MKLLHMLQLAPVIAVITVDDIEQAVPLARALVAGGLRMIEVELLTASGLGAIERIAGEVEGAIVGACDVVSAKDLKRSTKAGAMFATAPGFSPKLADDAEIPLLPGVATASEVMWALEHGHTHLKLFPVDAAGGIPVLKAFGGAFPEAGFVPAGGVTPAMAAHYLALPNVTCVAGSWVAPPRAVREGNWERVTFLAHEAAGLRQAA